MNLAKLGVFNRLFVTGMIMVLVLASPVAAQTSWQFSVDKGDRLMYKLEGDSYSGLFTVELTEVSVSFTEPVNIEPEASHTITANLTGEYFGEPVTLEMRYGWDRLPYYQLNQVQVSVIDREEPVFSAPYEDIFPFIWPADEEFFQEWVDTRTTLELEQSGTEGMTNTTIKVVESIDDTALDGCLCYTTIEIDNGITIRITQNETFFYTATGEPSVTYREITLQESELQMGWLSYHPSLLGGILSMIIMIVILRYRFGRVSSD